MKEHIKTLEEKIFVDESTIGTADKAWVILLDLCKEVQQQRNDIESIRTFLNYHD